VEDSHPPLFGNSDSSSNGAVHGDLVSFAKLPSAMVVAWRVSPMVRQYEHRAQCEGVGFRTGDVLELVQMQSLFDSNVLDETMTLWPTRSPLRHGRRRLLFVKRRWRSASWSPFSDASC
jgi:hypothetical protein